MTHGYVAKAPAARFWPKVDTSGGLFACWPWMANVTTDGYGQFYLGRIDGIDHNIRPHRFAYQELVGPIPDGLELDHVKARGCTTRLCCGDSPSGLNARKADCLRGHSLSGDNLFINANGRRVCRACARLRAQGKAG